MQQLIFLVKLCNLIEKQMVADVSTKQVLTNSLRKLATHSTSILF